MEKTFSAELSSLHPILDWVRTHLEETGLSDVEIRRIEIALEEGLVNIFAYAYQGETGLIHIRVRHEEKEFVEIIFEDEGAPFNPLKHPKNVDPLAPLEERELGGLGILFMEKLMDKVEYRRQSEKNILSLKKYLYN